MAKLERVTQKVFASQADNTGVFGSLQAGTPTKTQDVSQIQSLPAWDNGWNSATISGEKLPPLEEDQALDYVETRQLAYLYETGTAEYDPETNYCLGAECKEILTAGDFKIYSSLKADNKGNPLTDTTSWKVVFDTLGSFATQGWVEQNFLGLGYLGGGILEAPNGVVVDTGGFTPWTQPKLKTDTDYGVVSASSFYNANNTPAFPWGASDGLVQGGMDWAPNNQTPAWWNWDLPQYIKIKGLTHYNKNNQSSNTSITARFYTDRSLVTPIGDQIVTPNTNYFETVIQNIPAEGVKTKSLYFNKTAGGSGYSGMAEVVITAEVRNVNLKPADGLKVYLPNGLDAEGKMVNRVDRKSVV